MMESRERCKIQNTCRNKGDNYTRDKRKIRLLDFCHSLILLTKDHIVTKFGTRYISINLPIINLDVKKIKYFPTYILIIKQQKY